MTEENGQTNEEKDSKPSGGMPDLSDLLRKIMRDPIRMIYVYTLIILVGVLAFIQSGPPLVLLGIAISTVIGAVTLEIVIKRARKRRMGLQNAKTD